VCLEKYIGKWQSSGNVFLIKKPDSPLDAFDVSHLQ